MAAIALVAGDPSGDAHAARLIEALKRADPSLTFTALGGPAMQRSGAALLADLTRASSIGPFDAARHLARFARARRLFDGHLARHRPDLVILVDFGDFNLPVIAPLVKRRGIPILYYISPQLWAWGRFRLQWVTRYVDRMIVFFKFEEAFYRRAGVPVTWVGHPLVEEARPTMSRDAALLQRFGLNPWRRTVGLLPGSRPDEVRRHLPLMLAAARRIAWRMPGAQFLLPKAPNLPSEIFRAPLSRRSVDLHLAEGPMADVLPLMEAAVIASGTATLEAAVCGVPMVVVYRASWPTYLAARSVIRVPRIALVNIVADRAVVPELIQRRAAPARIATALLELLRDERACDTMRGALREVTARLGPPGAVERAAQVVLEALSAGKTNRGSAREERRRARPA